MPGCPAQVTANTLSSSTFLEGPVPAGGATITNLEAVIDTAPGAGNTVTIDVVDNSASAGGTSLLSCTISGASAVFCTNTGSASVAAGHYLELRYTNTVTGSPGAHGVRAVFRY